MARATGGLAGHRGPSVLEQRCYDRVHLPLEVGLVQAAVLEALAGVTDGDLAFGYPSADRTEDLA